jgi:hypothetical protein
MGLPCPVNSAIFSTIISVYNGQFGSLLLNRINIL